MPTKSKQPKEEEQDQFDWLDKGDKDILKKLFDQFKKQQQELRSTKSKSKSTPPAVPKSNKRRLPPPPPPLDFDTVAGNVAVGSPTPTGFDQLFLQENKSKSSIFPSLLPLHPLHPLPPQKTKGGFVSKPKSVQPTTKRRKELQGEEENMEAIFKTIMENQQQPKQQKFIITPKTKQKLKRNYEILCEKYESSTPYVIIIAEDPSTSCKTAYLVYHPDTDIGEILTTFETKHKPLRIHTFIWKDEKGDIVEFIK